MFLRAAFHPHVRLYIYDPLVGSPPVLGLNMRWLWSWEAGHHAQVATSYKQI
jgi:hypothetical protein